MKPSQIFYDSNLNTIIGSKKLNPFHFFKTIQSINERKTRYPLTENFLIKKVNQIPYRNFYVIESNKKYNEKLYNIEKAKVIPKINSVFFEYEKRIKKNKEKIKENTKRSLTLENQKYHIKIQAQEPKLLKTNYLIASYKNNHDKYKNLLLKNSRFRQRNKKPFKLKNKIKLPSISAYQDGMFSPLRTKTIFLDKENKSNQSNDNSIEQQDHKQFEISHQRQGHINNSN